MSPRQKAVVSAGVYIAAVVGLLTIGYAAVAVAMRVGVGFDDIATNKQGVTENRIEIGSLKETVIATHTHVEWIRDTMEKEHP